MRFISPVRQALSKLLHVIKHWRTYSAWYSTGKFFMHRRRLYLSLQLLNKYPKVLYGPFKGLKLANYSWCKADYSSMIFSIYEKEVSQKLVHFSEIGRHTLINIGFADGFYVTGCLTSGLFSNVIAY